MIYQLNKYPADRYNVLVPVTTLQAESNLQKITVSEVRLDTRQNYDNNREQRLRALLDESLDLIDSLLTEIEQGGGDAVDQRSKYAQLHFDASIM